VRLILASTNRAKRLALAERLGPGVLPGGLPPESSGLNVPYDLERGGSFAEIASAKAVWYSRRLPSEFVAATDGGLLVPALGMSWDPLQTARFAGSRATPGEHIARLLALAAGLRGADRAIAWIEHLSIARDGEIVASWTAGGPPGLLATTAQGAIAAGDGFWVPYIWCCPEFAGRRLTELSEVERLSRVDHWARLGADVTAWVRSLEP
jgi:inosine/xanthosine triphosphate pyrophosphatase family protein